MPEHKVEVESESLSHQLSHQKDQYEMKLALTVETCEERIKLSRKERESLVRQHTEEKTALETKIELMESQKYKIVRTSQQKLEADLVKQKKVYLKEIERLKADFYDQIEMLKKNHEVEKRSLSEMGMKVERGYENRLREVNDQLKAKDEVIKSNIFFLRFLNNVSKIFINLNF